MPDTSFLGLSKPYANMADLKAYCRKKSKMSSEELEDYDRSGLIALASKLHQLSLDEEKRGGKSGKSGHHGKSSHHGKTGHHGMNKKGKKYAAGDSDEEEEDEEQDEEETQQEDEDKPYRVYVGAYSAQNRKHTTKRYSTADNDEADEGEGKLFMTSDSDQEVDGTSTSEAYAGKKGKKGKKKSTKKPTKKGKAKAKPKKKSTRKGTRK